jgi:hypothetical protein
VRLPATPSTHPSAPRAHLGCSWAAYARAWSWVGALATGPWCLPPFTLEHTWAAEPDPNSDTAPYILRPKPQNTDPPDLLAEPDVELVQNTSPKLEAASLKPASYPANPDMEWCAVRVRCMLRIALCMLCCVECDAPPGSEPRAPT